MCLEIPFWVWFFKQRGNLRFPCMQSSPSLKFLCVDHQCIILLLGPVRSSGGGTGRSRCPGILCFRFLWKVERKILLHVQEQDPQRGTWNSFPQLGCPDFGFAKPFYTDPGKYGGFKIKNNWAVSVVCPDNVSALVIWGLVFSCKGEAKQFWSWLGFIV